MGTSLKYIIQNIIMSIAKYLLLSNDWPCRRSVVIAKCNDEGRSYYVGPGCESIWERPVIESASTIYKENPSLSARRRSIRSLAKMAT